ncbi:MAG: SMC family ATPase [Pseudomonadales bacterium]|nr:SMC family ATPase [Pseudomonadales bacterium]
MKPIKLSLQAFGPFAGREVIDFTLLGENPLFLINGPTGAGKSSILDAICFALYGSTTSKEREATAMRCDFADNDVLTEVELTFTLGEDQYRIKRLPTQLINKKRGEGTTERKTEATLEKIAKDGQITLLVAKKATEATKFIEDVTGLNVDQFRQVMVLPQGKFREFLMADSADREKIFSKLFQTQIYKRIEEGLKEQASDINKQHQQLKTRKLAFLESAGFDDDADEAYLAECLTDAKEAQQQALAAKDKVNEEKENAKTALDTGQQLQSQFINLQQQQQRLDVLDTQQAEIKTQEEAHQKAVLSEKIRPVFDRLQEVGKEQLHKQQAHKALLDSLTHIQQASENSLLQLDNAKAAMPEALQLHSQIQQLMLLQPKILQLTNTSKEKQQWQKTVTDQQKTEQQLQNQLKEVQGNISKATARIQAIKPEVAQLAVLQQQLSVIEIRGKEKSALDKLLKAGHEKHSEYEKLSQLTQRAQAQVDTATLHLDQLSLRWHQNQAAVLAEKLLIGEPCQVCGSIEHPQPANTKQQAFVSEEDLATARQQLKTGQSQLNTLLQQQAGIQAASDALQTQIAEQQQRLGDDAALSTDDIRQQYQQCKEQVNHILALEKELQCLEAQQQQQHTQEQQVNEQWRGNQTQISESQQRLAVALEQEQQLLQDLPDEYRNENSLNTAIKTKENQKAALDSALQQAEVDFNQQQQALTQHQTSIHEQDQQLQILEQRKKAQEILWADNLCTSSFSDNTDFQAALLSHKVITQLADSIKQFNDALLSAHTAISTIKNNLGDVKQPNIEQLETEFDACSQRFNDVFTLWQQQDNRLNQLNQLMTQLQKLAADNAALDQQYRIYGTLADAAAGNNTQRLSLQRFVLSVLLDDVLILASQRLSLMSKGRYQLIRKEERAKGNKASGLEMEVEDAYTGKTRSVATLSGGESFMAALSLALGLSDVVQAYAGGIKLDTLFIDEGFGSLDQESLDLAIKTLIDLQSAGRTIGIISHVSELKEQMALRVDVNISSAGSTISLAE